MKSLKIALLQLLPADSMEANRTKGIQACRNAKAMGADIALFPEMWSTGYTIPESIEELEASSIGWTAFLSVRLRNSQGN